MPYSIESYDVPKSFERYSADLTAMECIDDRCFEKAIAYNRATFAWLIANHNYRLIVARDSEKAMKALCLYKLLQNPYRIHIVNLAVDPDARGSNLGYKMMRAAHEAACKPIHAPFIPIDLECRPINESYYKKMGFKVVAPPTPNYYPIDNSHELPSIPMRAMGLKEQCPSTQSRKKASTRKAASELNALLSLVDEIRQSTSYWYRGFWHSARKEKAFDAIYKELMVACDHKKPLTEDNTRDVLRAIIANSLIVRGYIGSRTASSNKALACLNSEKYAVLKSIISNNQEISRDDLLRFAQVQELSSKKYQDSYPYCHFYKLPVANVPGNNITPGLIKR